MTKYKTREEWLVAAVAALRTKVFIPSDVKLPDVIRVSTGWPAKHSKGSIGWCYKTEAADDSSTNVFVSPAVSCPNQILAVLTHELIHASDDCRSKHSGYFAKTHAKVGLVGKPTACDVGPELARELEAIASKLGEYPHAALTHPTKEKTQTTRMIKLTCRDSDCGCIARTTTKWLESIGAPSCACGLGPMLTDEELENLGQEDEEGMSYEERYYEGKEAEAAWREREGDWGP